ncbi:hypothetical protein ABH926_009497 [Catenulispora sp. GP43]|uniref:hypothetical protein n=1 Tax=Catenulispora sp. GP43 TaxID=3156263 RepID=UPI0035199673
MEAYHDEGPVVLGDELLELPGFWAAYLLWLCGTQDDVDVPRPALFGADEADCDAAYERLHSFERWPLFRIPFADGHSVSVLGRNFEDDEGLDFHVTHPEWDTRRRLAGIEGHWAGPGLAWPELVHIAAHPDSGAEGIHDPDARLLLLLPALGDAETPPDAAEVVAEALIGIGVPAETAPETAARMLTDLPFWGPAEWLVPAVDEGSAYTGILVCDDPHSPRCGLGLAHGLTADQGERLARALGTWPG